jgi:acyl-CoA synthetase (AMP-forming)/AMP-acid ligase II
VNVFESLHEYGDNLCVVENNRQYTYAQCQQKVNELACYLQLDDARRRLIFIEVDNTLLSLIAYLVCLQHKHPVLLLNSGSKAQNTKLVSLYKPNLYLNATGAEISVIDSHHRQYELHENLMLLLSTSGSTGAPKLVKLSHKNMHSNAKSIVTYLGLTSQDCAISSLKFSYSYGLSILHSHLMVGASIVLTEANALSAEFWDMIDTHAVTSFSGVPHHFETLSKQKIIIDKHPTIRYLTQAGGKLSPKLVSEFAGLGKQRNFKFYVMYGQTEAAPRIAYLPSHLAETLPNAIGMAIPGGQLLLVDENNNEIVFQGQVGELVYKGPNIMMGYALNSNALAIQEDIPLLKTGDLAVQIQDGIFEITGRLSRFAKPMGFRVNLNEIKEWLFERGINAEVTSNSKEEILLGVVSSAPINLTDVLLMTASHLQLPKSFLMVKSIPNIPLLPNDKVDFIQLQKDIQHTSYTEITLYFINSFFIALREKLGIKTTQYASLLEIFDFYFSDYTFSSIDSFTSLHGDSLVYVQLSIDLERYLNAQPPNNWHVLSISQLEELKNENTL